MPFRWLDDAPTSDAGFEAWGDTLAECFRSAADALLALMLGNPEGLQARERRSIDVAHEALDFLLVRFLEEILYFKDAERLLLRVAQCEVEGGNGQYRAVGELEGEPIDPQRHSLSADVKAITLHRLSVTCREGQWIATVVVDL